MKYFEVKQVPAFLVVWGSYLMLHFYIIHYIHRYIIIYTIQFRLRHSPQDRTSLDQKSISRTTTLRAADPQSRVPSQLLFSLLTHTCESLAPVNHIKLAVVGLISKNYESAYREEKQQLTHWCRGNNLSLNVDRAKEIIDFNKPQIDHSPLNTDRSFVGIVKNTKYLDFFFLPARVPLQVP